MPRVAVLMFACVLAACSSGDTAAPAVADTSDGTGDDASAADVSSDSSEAPPTTAPVLPEPTADCESEPDPADYVEGRVPPVNTPCEIPTELVVHPIRDGVGPAAEAGDTMIVDYTGIRSADGTLFDTSYTREVPFDFVLGRGGVIAGWDEGLLGLRAGSAVKLDVPAELAYGDTPPGGADSPIQPGDALTFVVEVRAVVPAVTAADAPLDLQVAPSVGAVEVTADVLTPGDGATVELGDTAVVHLLLVRGDNQIVLLDTWERTDPIQIIMEEGQTLPGVFIGLQGARVGSRLVITMPPEDAFGPDGQASLGLPAATDLIAVVDVVGVY